MKTKFNFSNEFGVYKGKHFFSQKNSSKNLIIVHSRGINGNMYNWLIKPLVEAKYNVNTFTVPHSSSMNTPNGAWTSGITTCMDVLNLKEVILIGHSMGGYASLIDSYDKRIVKIIALAPSIVPNLPQPPLEYSIPIQIQCGTKDNLFSAIKEFYDKITASGSNAKFVIIEKGDHIQFMDRWFASITRFIIILGIPLPYIGNRTNLAEISIQEQHNQSLKEVMNWC